MKDKIMQDDKILLAIYSEWLKDVPQIDHVNPQSMDMEDEVFLWGIIKLKTTGLIDGVSWQPPGIPIPGRSHILSRDNLVLTGEGVKRAEYLLDLPRQKRVETWTKLYDIFKGIESEVIVSLLKENLHM